jgi:beta-glucosidase/6-phospho-beta-glucosidase/beta-galactosidase
MFLSFPEHFFWGTSTAAAQVETAGDHPWRGLKAKDGYRFERTTDHELRREADAEFILRFGHGIPLQSGLVAVATGADGINSTRLL